jgi:hypothetical protein
MQERDGLGSRADGRSQFVHSERLTPELGGARLQREGRSAPLVREMTAAVPQSHGMRPACRL